MDVSTPQRLRAALQRSVLCVGMDPHPGELAHWGLPDSPAGAREFSLRILDAAQANVGIIKPQVAFYERFGHAGFAVLEEVLRSAQDVGIFVIADAKRGDIGSTMAGYTAAWAGTQSPLRADALTVSPYLGAESLSALVATLGSEDAMTFVLALTSNPGAGRVQRAVDETGTSVAAGIIAYLNAANRELGNTTAGQDVGPSETHHSGPDQLPTGLGRCGIVVGATIAQPPADVRAELAEFTGPILTPGYGAQGATAEDLRALFPHALAQRSLIINSSRGISRAGPALSDLRTQITNILGDLQHICP